MVECDWCSLVAMFWISTTARKSSMHAHACRRHLSWAVENIAESTYNAVRVEVL